MPSVLAAVAFVPLQLLNTSCSPHLESVLLPLDEFLDDNLLVVEVIQK